LRIEVFPGAEGAGEFRYYTGKNAQTITAKREKNTETIQFADLGIPGNLEVYCDKVSGVEKNGAQLREGPGYRYDGQAKRLTVPFDGATRVIIQGAASLFPAAPAH